MKATKKSKGYFLYPVNGQNLWELWKGEQGTEWAYRAGYVADPKNFQVAIEAAQEEMRYLMAQG